MPDMGTAIAARKQDLDERAQKLASLVSEQHLGLAVRKHDAPGLVGHDDGVGRRFEEIAVLRLDELGVAQNLEMRDVLLRDDDEFRAPLGVVDGLVRNDGVDERAVLAKPRRFKCREAGGERFAPELIEVVNVSVRDDQGVDRAAEGVRARIPEQPFGAVVPVEDFAGWRGDGDRVGKLPQEKIGQLARKENSFRAAFLFP
jgi:hypothetical protein